MSQPYRQARALLRSALVRRPQLARRLIGPAAWWLLVNGEPELRLLKLLVDPARNSVDVGANIGLYSYWLSKRSRHVYAYEPNPDVLPLLRAARRANVTVFDVALSSSSGHATLSVPIDAGAPRDTRGSLGADPTGGNQQRAEVITRRLDDADHEDVGFIKIDVEGHEGEVIAGARELLARDRPTLLVEIEERHVGRPVLEVGEEIASLGYSAFFLDRGLLRPMSAFDASIHQAREAPAAGYVNSFVFLPAGPPPRAARQIDAA